MGWAAIAELQSGMISRAQLMELGLSPMQAKSDLNSGQMQLKHFQSEIPDINQKYVALKRAYDALDIEYAQLYEKQSQAAAA